MKCKILRIFIKIQLNFEIQRMVEKVTKIERLQWRAIQLYKHVSKLYNTSSPFSAHSVKELLNSTYFYLIRYALLFDRTIRTERTRYWSVQRYSALVSILKPVMDWFTSEKHTNKTHEKNTTHTPNPYQMLFEIHTTTSKTSVQRVAVATQHTV